MAAGFSDVVSAEEGEGVIDVGSVNDGEARLAGVVFVIERLERRSEKLSIVCDGRAARFGFLPG